VVASKQASNPPIERQPALKATLRTPTPADYALITSWVPDAAACLRWAGPRVPFPFASDELPTLLSATDGKSYCLAVGEGVPYGFGQHFASQPSAVHLGRIIVSPTARGHGFGRLLCQELIVQAFQATGANAVTLRVYRDNPTALALYSSLGFSPIEAESTAEVLFMKMQANSIEETPDEPGTACCLKR